MRRHRRGGLGRTVRNVAVSALVLLLLFVGAGVAYVLVAGGQDDSAKNDQVPTAPPPDTGIPKPHKPAPNAPESAAIESLLSPVKAGENTSASVKTNAGSKCSISVTYNDVPSKDSGLTTKTADDYGNVTWSWTVDKTAPVGKWQVKVTCFYGKKSAVVIGDLQVTK